MKVYKWKKSDVDPIKLLQRVNAVVGARSFPSFVFVSPKRMNDMRRFLHKQFKKEKPYLGKKQIIYATELHMLNFSPCEVKGLPNDIVIVDDIRIKEEGNVKL